MLTAPELDEVADQLLRARRSATTLEPPSSRYPSFTVADGYAVARRMQEARSAAGARVVGAKLGFTNEAVWELLGTDQPFWAPVYDDTVSSDRAVSLTGMVEPRIEPEIVVGLGRPLTAGAGRDEVLEAVAWVALGFELAQCRYPDWVLSAGDAVADGGLHGLLVVGDRVEHGGRAGDLADTVLELSCDGAPMARGRAADVLGGPVAGLEWLVRLPGIETVPSGSIVTTGSLTAPAPVHEGQVWRANATGPVALGTLQIVLGP